MQYKYLKRGGYFVWIRFHMPVSCSDNGHDKVTWFTNILSHTPKIDHLSSHHRASLPQRTNYAD